MIIQIALGIVLAVIILAFLGEIIAVGIFGVLGILALLIGWFFFSNIDDIFKVVFYLTLIFGGAFVASVLFGILCSRIPFFKEWFKKNEYSPLSKESEEFIKAYSLKKDDKDSFFEYLKSVSSVYATKGFILLLPVFYFVFYFLNSIKKIK